MSHDTASNRCSFQYVSCRELYHNNASQSIQGNWDDTETIADRIEQQDAERIGEAAVVDALGKAGLT